MPVAIYRVSLSSVCLSSAVRLCLQTTFTYYGAGGDASGGANSNKKG